MIAMFGMVGVQGIRPTGSTLLRVPTPASGLPVVRLGLEVTVYPRIFQQLPLPKLAHLR